MSKKAKDEISKGEIIIYKSKEGIGLKVRLEDETVWLTQKQMAELFEKGIPTINEHIKNIYKENELKENSTIRKFRIVQVEGKRSVERELELFNLDVIISVGYRVKSLRGTQFRIWANKTLKDHLVKGYTINEKRILETQEKFNQLTETIEFLKDKSSQELLDVLNPYQFSSFLHQLNIFFFHIIRKKTNLYKVFPIIPLTINFI